MGISLEKVFEELTTINNDVIKYYLNCVDASEKQKNDIAKLISEMCIQLTDAGK